MTGTTAATKKNEGKDGDVLVPGDGFFTMIAIGTTFKGGGTVDGAKDNDIEKTANANTKKE